jgi:hypothetical protein
VEHGTAMRIESTSSREADVTARRTWLDGRVDTLVDALADYGMSASRTATAELVEERVQWVSSQMRISPAAARHYLTDDALRDLARTMVLSVADEAPGADVLAAARSSAVPVPVLGRCIAGLSQALLLRLVERDDLEHVRTTCTQLVQTLSAIGQIVADHDAGSGRTTPTVMTPPALLNRAARYLEAAAGLVADDGVLPEGFDPALADGLSATFAKDAASVRYFAGE